MSSPIRFEIDGRPISAQPGQTILAAALENGVYIPHLCAHPELRPWGACRVCTVKVNGRPQPACVQPVAAGALVESDTPELLEVRRSLVEMLFVEGNHFCPACEKSGDCELQALAYRLGIETPRYPYAYPERELDLSHPDVMLERNRCILCARCVRASQDLDAKQIYDFVGRGLQKRIAVDADRELARTPAAATDQAVAVCPVGCLMEKRVGFAVPVGQRRFDARPIGSDLRPPAEE
jgi:[NiFe] hydrogenase diaphorase moiety small subunit